MLKNELKKVMIMGGGTGGHIFPGLALAKYLHQQGVEVHWLGTSQGLESEFVPSANFPIHYISVKGLRGKGIKAYLTAPVRIAGAIFEAYRIIQAIRPDIVIGMGGFVSGPGGIASYLKRLPLIIHEQNAKAGLTNKILARFAHRVLEGFPDAFHTIPQAKRRTIGNPVRSDIACVTPPHLREHHNHTLQLLVLGGSLGAEVLNEFLPKAVSALPEHLRPSILHQTGKKHFEQTIKRYAQLGLKANLQAFLDPISDAYEWADLVLCRAGALTVSELCAAGLGAIFVPYPYAVDDHQTANAHYMVQHEAALCIQQSDLSIEKLGENIKYFAQNLEECHKMAQRAYELRQTNVTEKIFGILLEVLNKKK